MVSLKLLLWLRLVLLVLPQAQACLLIASSGCIFSDVGNIDHARPREGSHIANIHPMSARKGEAINVQNFSIDRREDRKTGGKGK
jgi:hypothetical protein